MERAMLSLDFLITVLVLVTIGGTMVSFGFVQAENSVANGMKYKAEAYAMGIGSAINNFAAINPAPGDSLLLNLSDPEPIGNYTLAGGWSPVGRVMFKSCNISFSNTGANNPKYILVNFTFYRLDSDIEQSVTGAYPVVSTAWVSYPAGSGGINCNGSINFHDNTIELKEDQP